MLRRLIEGLWPAQSGKFFNYGSEYAGARLAARSRRSVCRFSVIVLS